MSTSTPTIPSTTIPDLGSVCGGVSESPGRRVRNPQGCGGSGRRRDGKPTGRAPLETPIPFRLVAPRTNPAPPGHALGRRFRCGIPRSGFLADDSWQTTRICGNFGLGCCAPGRNWQFDGDCLRTSFRNSRRNWTMLGELPRVARVPHRERAPFNRGITQRCLIPKWQRTARFC